MDRPIEPPATYKIMFKNGMHVSCRIDQTTIEAIASDLRRGYAAGAYDVETAQPGGSEYRKLMFRFEDILYIG